VCNRGFDLGILDSGRAGELNIIPGIQ
jgi:hypothetical protein